MNLYDYERIVKENEEIKEIILEIVTQHADDLCWRDVYLKLAKFVNIKITPETLALLPHDKMMSNCERFSKSIRGDCPYEKDFATERIKTLEMENEWYRKNMEIQNKIIDQKDLLNR